MERGGEGRAAQELLDPAETVGALGTLGVCAQGNGQFGQGRGEQQVVVGEVRPIARDVVAHRERVDELGPADSLSVGVTGQHLGFDSGGVDGSLEGRGEAVDPRHQIGAPEAGGHGRPAR